MTNIGSKSTIIFNTTLVSSSNSVKRPKSTHLLWVRRKGFQASLKGTHCTALTAVIAMHQIRQHINTMWFASLNLRVVKTDAYKASMETLASVIPHMKSNSAM